MRERGMIFNAEMVRALLDGRKTQTRRTVKNQWISGSWSVKPAGVKRHYRHTHDWWLPTGSLPYSALPGCPFGVVGDRMWVRETWAVVSHAFDDDGLMVDYVPDRPALAVHEKSFGQGYYSGHTIYAADGAFTWSDDDGCVDGRSCWKPSIHMPRWASRITLEITDVRVERLNDISQEDAIAEGIDLDTLAEAQDNYDCIADHNMTGRPTATGAFQHLWESIYGPDSWQANQWVWVIEFKCVEVANA